MNLRNDHDYQGEPLEFRRLRLRARAEDPRPGLDLEHDRTDDFDPATDRWPNACTHPGTLSLARSCSTPAAPAVSRQHEGAAVHGAAGGPGSSCPPTAHPNRERAA